MKGSGEVSHSPHISKWFHGHQQTQQQQATIIWRVFLTTSYMFMREDSGFIFTTFYRYSTFKRASGFHNNRVCQCEFQDFTMIKFPYTEHRHFSGKFALWNKYQLSASSWISIINTKISTFNFQSPENQFPPAQHLQTCWSLTILNVVEHDELLPAQLLHQSQHDIVKADGRPGSERVALPARARVELAGSPRWSLAVPLDVQVWDVHGVRQGLQCAGWRAACRGDQR